MFLIERARALSHLQDLLQAAQDNRGSIAVITGPVAVGKTELAHSLVQTAEKELGVVVLNAQALTAEGPDQAGIFEQLAQGLESTYGEAADPGPPDVNGSPAERSDRQIAEDIVRFSRRTPLLVVVDDLHHGDPESLAGVLHLVRLARTARIMVVLVLPDCSRLDIPLFHAELLREPHCTRFSLSPLSSAGVLEVVARSLDPGTAERTAEDYHRFSGGNPLVLRALIEESRGTESATAEEHKRPDEGRVRAGQISALAVLTSLHRSGPEAVEVARGIALLGPVASVEMLALLLGSSTDLVAYRIRTLRDAGILHEMRFRHPGAAEMVLGDPEFGQLQATHYRVAVLLEAEGFSPSRVARHLVAAGTTTGAWTTSVLRESAQEAIGQNDWAFAAVCLELAMRGPLDEEDKGLVITELIRAQWRLNPARVIKYLPQCYELQRKGMIPDRDLVSLTGIFLWHGRAEEAATMLADAAGRATDPADRAELHCFLSWATISYPELRARMSEADDSLFDRLSEAVDPGSLRLQGALHAAFGAQGRSDVGTLTESVLSERVTHSEAVATVLQVLVYADELELAEEWDRRVMADTAEPGPSSSRGVHHAIRAEIMRRRGDLSAAEWHAETALKHMAPRAWGVALGLPLAVLVSAHTARGNLAQADEYLSWIVPQEMSHTLYGVAHLHARGRYRLAAGQHWAAQQDFLSCGELVTRWNMDVASFVPWRLGAAEAALAQGDRPEARRLVEQHLRQPHGSLPQSRGAALRVYAGAVDGHRRLTALTEAAELLSEGSNWHQRFLVLTDLSLAYQDLGDSQRARTTGEQAWHSAIRCGAERLARTLLPHSSTAARPDPTELPTWSVIASAQLSEAELRVAELAAAGDTNREVSRKLFITISTVEQHLTRVYRKLQLSGRTDLQRYLAGDSTVGSVAGRSG
ncbi:AAA family ATPase [Streptomyces phaeochromogenes]|uniref:helix-turn-helix transcriptional regulator n=1 Tax=Streptomyces phaeochromogenes TaxID=1923 RepID=UPI0033C13B53|nr:AAA family ATPase [Streptomyces phaeochromogenes]